EIEDIVLHPQALLLGLRRGPVQHVDVVTALEKKLDEALARYHIKDIAAVGRRHHDQDRHPVDFIRERPIVIEVHRAAGAENIFRSKTKRWPGGRDIFDTLDAALDRTLNLGLNPLRDR